MPFQLANEVRSLKNRLNSPEPPQSDSLLIEKDNLLCVFKLVIKDLLDSSLKHERLLEKEHFPLKHFFIVFEQILYHGYLGKKTFPISTSSTRKDLWPIIDLITRKSTDSHTTEIATSSKEMTNIRTSLGRVRAWLRLALMQKHLSDYFKILIEQKQELTDLYEQDALLLADESHIITGLLVGLNVLDFNFCLKEAVLDYPIESTIHYSVYLRERRAPKNTHPPGAIQDPTDEFDDYSPLSSASSSPKLRINAQNDNPMVITNTNGSLSLDGSSTDNSYDQRLTNVLDQKHYVEEINRKLQMTVNTLQERVQLLDQTNKSILEDGITTKTRLGELAEQLAKVTLENEELQSSCQRKIETLKSDMEVERQTYQQSRSGLDSIYTELHKKYEEERTSKQKIESVYQTQLSQNTEIIESTKMMEKDIEVKTTLYDQIKEQNSLLKEKLKVESSRNDEKEHQLQKMEKENQMLRQTMNELETNIEQMNMEMRALGDTNNKLSQTLVKSDTEKSSLETDLRVEQEFHQRLQKALTNEKDKVSTLQFDIHVLNLMKQEYDLYKQEMIRKENEFEKKFEEQEETIKELALKLEVSITREDEFREKDGLRSSTWMKDEDVKECCQCKKDFNALRRKHHCRHCGQIFCEACVSTKLTLASSNKPVRVCDMCCKRVLSQCAVKTP